MGFIVVILSIMSFFLERRVYVKSEVIAASYYYPIYRLFQRFLNSKEFQNHREIIQNAKSVNGPVILSLLEDLEQDSHNLDTNTILKAMKIVHYTPNNFKQPARLASVFSFLELEKSPGKVQFYPLKMRSPDAGFPSYSEGIVKEDEFSRFIKEFCQSIESVWQCVHPSDHSFLVKLQGVVEQYGWAIPAGNSPQLVNVSLSEQCKIIAALTSALSNTPDQHSDFITLVVGDLSGIQKYIFDIAQTGAGGVAKRLRARSFFLSMLLVLITHDLLKQFDAPMFNLLMSSGGKFYILLPGGENTEKRIQQIQSELDKWFLEHYYGEIVCNLGQVTIKAEELSSMGSVLERLNHSLQERKNSPLQQGLISNLGKWDSSRYLLSHMKTDRMCVSCRKFQAVNGNLCRICDADEQIGRKLTRAKYLIFRRKGSPENINWKEYSVETTDRLPQSGDGIYLIYQLNNPILPNTGLPIFVKYMANHIPVASSEGCIHCIENQLTEQALPGNPLFFDCIAFQAKGKKRLGFYKADVDHLGSLFVFGLQKDQQEVQLTQISTLSQMLDLFFSGWLNELIQKKFPYVYTVFSGGDDLFFIGPWDQTLNLSQEIQLNFEKYVGHNPNVTLSAGITFCKPKAPVYKQTSYTENELEHAKEVPSIMKKEGRNQISIFEQSMTWKEFESTFKEAEKIGTWWNENKIKSAFIYRLLNYAEMFERFLHGDTHGLQFIPLLTYDMARNLRNRDKENDKDTDNKDNNEIIAWAQRFLTVERNNPLLHLKTQVQLAKLFREDQQAEVEKFNVS
jgi:CRISPR-associated protein Csm1